MKIKTKSKTLNFRISEDDLAKIRRLAAKEKKTITDFVIKKALGKHDEN